MTRWTPSFEGVTTHTRRHPRRMTGSILSQRKSTLITIIMPNPSNPLQAALAFLDGKNFSADSYFEAWNFDNAISGISATTIDEHGNSREF